ncbi:MAG: divalent-cation tolerance protein CutA [Candidatus Micrarchaeota archaeon]
MEIELLEICVLSGSMREAKKIAETLVKEKLAACANISECNSTYFWKGKMEKHTEWQISLTSMPQLFAEAEKRIKELHTYELPAITAIPIAKANESYAKWVVENVKK